MDDLYQRAVEIVCEEGVASTSLLQRKLLLGYLQAANLIDDMEHNGIIGPYIGSSDREVLISCARQKQQANATTPTLRANAFLAKVFSKGALITLIIVSLFFTVGYIAAYPHAPNEIEDQFKAIPFIYLLVVAPLILLVYHAAAFVFSRTAAGRTARARAMDASLHNGEVNIDALDGPNFELFCSRLLVSRGFTDVRSIGGGGDHGVDILANKDGNSYAVQCKRYSGSVGNKAIQEAFSGREYYKADIAAVLTNSRFTEQAKDEAERYRVKLWDRDVLREMMNA